MNLQSEQPGKAGANQAAIKASLALVHNFLQAFPAETIDEHAWNLLSNALGNDALDDSSSNERILMANFYRELKTVAPALKVIDEEVGPLYNSPNEEAN